MISSLFAEVAVKQGRGKTMRGNSSPQRNPSEAEKSFLEPAVPWPGDPWLLTPRHFAPRVFRLTAQEIADALRAGGKLQKIPKIFRPRGGPRDAAFLECQSLGVKGLAREQ
jgi:hypothetical protein